MGAGAKSEAIRLTSAANDLIERFEAGEPLTDVLTDRMARLHDHGISRRVDHRIRQLSTQPAAWSAISAEQVGPVASLAPGMLVLLGSHPNGHVRQVAVEIATARLLPADSSVGRKAPVGLTRMLARRALDPTPQVREASQSALALLFANELTFADGTRMPNGIERATREIVAQTRSVTVCSHLVDAALDLFDSRVGRYSVDGVRDHHQHTLQEVDRRAQVLGELEVMLPRLDDEAALATGTRLADFYRRSLRPVRHYHEPVLDPT